jgi:hypothetical protein
MRLITGYKNLSGAIVSQFRRSTGADLNKKVASATPFLAATFTPELVVLFTIAASIDHRWLRQS